MCWTERLIRLKDDFWSGWKNYMHVHFKRWMDILFLIWSEMDIKEFWYVKNAKNDICRCIVLTCDFLLVCFAGQFFWPMIDIIQCIETGCSLVPSSSVHWSCSNKRKNIYYDFLLTYCPVYLTSDWNYSSV